jgi:glycerol-3-phosphate dehydrogenase
MRRSAEKLSSTRFDLVVIGGGVNGAATAREAAWRGLKVALV